MSTLGFNYNIQGMKLLHELKALFPSITDDAVKACMKKVIPNQPFGTLN